MGCSCSQKNGAKTSVQKVRKPPLEDAGEEVAVVTDHVQVANKDGGPPPSVLLRRWSLNSLDSASSLLSLQRVAAGHGGTSILKYVDKHADSVPETPKFVMKVWDDAEARVYQDLMAAGDRLLQFTPSFHGEVEKEDLSPDLQDRYMRLSNVLQRFGTSPNVMDCKLGVRSFTEGEVHKKKLREDLYKKLVQLDPTAPTAEEHEAQACTKYRWMSTNDNRTTLRSLGFRIDGIENSKGKTAKEDLRGVRALPDAASLIAQEFLPRPEGGDGPCEGGSSAAGTPRGERGDSAAAAEGASACEERPASQARATAEQILQRLRALREAMCASDFVRSHAFIGCSLLFVADAQRANAGVFLIDFAHTTPLPEGVHIDHRSPWEAGNHEDGILLGLDNVIACWESILEGLDAGAKSSGGPLLSSL